MLSSSSDPSASWLSDTETAIQNQASQGGLLGMLSNAAAGNNDGSVNSFLTNSSSTANAFATIAQTSISNMSSLIVQESDGRTNRRPPRNSNKPRRTHKRLQQQNVQPTNTLDPFIYFSDGTSIDTTNNIMTMPDGTQYDTTTGAKYVNPADIIQMANGAYLDTQNNILTMSDGTQIDTVTGLTVSTTA